LTLWVCRLKINVLEEHTASTFRVMVFCVVYAEVSRGRFVLAKYMGFEKI
jgi:hypothetical protein